MLYVNPVSSLDSFRAEGLPDGEARRRAALEELDRLFAFTLLQEMRKTVPDEGLLGSSNERKLYEEMLDDAFAGQMARTGQLGLARQVEAQLKAQESQAARPLDRGFLPLRETRRPLPLERQAIDLKPVRPAMPLDRQSDDANPIPLIKAPLKIADN